MLLFNIYIIIHTLKRNSNRQISTITFQINSNEKKEMNLHFCHLTSHGAFMWHTHIQQGSLKLSQNVYTIQFNFKWIENIYLWWLCSDLNGIYKSIWTTSHIVYINTNY